jgi:hypothetical protein
MEESVKETKAATTGLGGQAKKPYAAPSLVEYGSIEKLTQNGTGTGIDAMGRMVCL